MATTFENFATSQMTDITRRPGANALKVTKVVFNDEAQEVPTVSITLGGSVQEFDLYTDTLKSKIETQYNSGNSIADVIADAKTSGSIVAK